MAAKPKHGKPGSLWVGLNFEAQEKLESTNGEFRRFDVLGVAYFSRGYQKPSFL